ncbi:MAG: alpha/beta hydrolase [Desulfobacteraceae bacterium]|nr:alpha/beta hydrolase [Desulfobacteraceae bacterium]
MNRYPLSIHVISLFLVLIFFYAETKSEGGECAVLLHGLARTEKSMSNLEQYLESIGFTVKNIDYPSREKTVQVLSEEVIPGAIELCIEQDVDKIHFVTHSMGGILIRYYLEHNQVPRLGRIVMLSPPNNGSEVVDKLKGTPIFRWLNGPAGQQLGTDNDSLPKKLGVPNYEVGIITGDKTINPILSLLIPGIDDGKVSVENAKLRGMKDFLVVHESHPFIMDDKTVFHQVSFFLKNGLFDRNKK